MENLDKAFDKKFSPICPEDKKLHAWVTMGNSENWRCTKCGREWSWFKDFIRQREKDLLKEVTERIESYKISGELPEEEQRINDLLDEIIEDDIKELSNE